MIDCFDDWSQFTKEIEVLVYWLNIYQHINVIFNMLEFSMFYHVSMLQNAFVTLRSLKSTGEKQI